MNGGKMRDAGNKMAAPGYASPLPWHSSIKATDAFRIPESPQFLGSTQEESVKKKIYFREFTIDLLSFIQG